MAKQSRGSDQAMIRLPDGMRDRIKAAAEKNNRSMNAEIVSALDAAYPSGITLGDFFDQWAGPTARAKTKKERDELINAANEASRLAGESYLLQVVDEGVESFVEFLAKDINGEYVLIATLSPSQQLREQELATKREKG
jgi:hypothetical protein